MERPKRRKDEDGFVSPSSSTDRISELPQPILHHIISFLSQNEAVQTCLLSESWRHLWCGRPILEFRQKLFRGNDEKTFLTILDQTLQRYSHQNLSIKQFVVEMATVDCAELTSLLKKWIPILFIYLGVETFHLTLYNRHSYAIPRTCLIFQAEFLKELHLGGCKIESTGDKLCLNHLITLSLKRVYIEDDKTFEKIMASCPLIQHLELDRCEGLTTVKVNNNLKHFGCLDSSRNIEIKVPSTLETIKVMSCFMLYLHHINNNNSYLPLLKSLYLAHVQLSEEFPAIFSCNSPCLEDFELRSCSGLSQVKISNRSVKHLIIADWEEQIKIITVDAPNILCFDFTCRSSVPSISFATVASSEWKSNNFVSIKPEISNDGISPWFLKLHEVVKALSQSQITLNFLYGVVMNQHIEVTDHVGYCKPIVVEHLVLTKYASSDDFATLFNCLFRIFRPRYIHMRMYTNPTNPCGMRILQDNNNKLAEFIRKTNLKDEEPSRCCFWQQELKELSLEIFNHDSSQWHLVQESRIAVDWR